MNEINTSNQEILSSEHNAFLLAELNSMRKSEQFTDVTLICNDVRIPAHRNVLAAASPYFKAMFQGHFPESSQREITISEMDAVCLEQAVDYIYSGTIKINMASVHELLATVSFLQLEHLTTLCAIYLSKHLDADNCMNLKRFAEIYNIFSLVESTKNYIATNFQEIVQSQEFMGLTYAELIDILKNDAFYVHSNDVVLRGIVRWVKYNREERVSNVADLLRFINPSYVRPVVARTMPFPKDDADCTSWLNSVQNSNEKINWHIFVLDKMGQQGDFYRFDLSTGAIANLNPLPRSLFALSLAAYKNVVFVQGGNQKRCTRYSYYYDIYSDQWHELHTMTMERARHRSVMLNDCLYALGGTTLLGSTNSVECFYLGANNITTKAFMLDLRCSMGAAVCENAIYVMGGESDNRSLRSTERYDPRVGIWHRLPQMHEVNGYCSSAVIGTDIFCCEGIGRCMERFDLRTNKWDIIDLWETREFSEILTANNQLYSVSGDYISKFDATANKWSDVYKFPTTREWDTAVGLQMVNYSF